MSHVIRPLLASTMGVTVLAAVAAVPTPARGQITFDHYHRWEEAHDIMSSLARRYPGLTELYSMRRNRGIGLACLQRSNIRGEIVLALDVL